MPPKKKTPAPIDRPLSRAYLRGFTGWSTAFPPGHSEPTSLRVMENVMVDRNGSLLTRPGMRYISYSQSPDTDPLTDAVEGIAIDRPLVGTQEPFYVIGGDKALLFAVRETDLTVGWRALLFTGTLAVVHRLTDPAIGFTFPQGEAVVNFTAATTHVEYLQIDNKIIALSDAGEPARMFFVGAEKVGKRINTVTNPRWEDSHKPTVVHPDKTWIDKQPYTIRRNEIFNSSFEIGGAYWTRSALCDWYLVDNPAQADGRYLLALKSRPARTNMQTSPLHDVSATGTAGWHPHQDWGDPDLSKDGDWMKIYDKKGKGTFLAYGARITQGVVANHKYQVALDYDCGTHVEPIVVLTFYNAAGVKIGNSTSLAMSKTGSHYGSSGVLSPAGTVSMRVSVGGRNEKSTSTWVKVKNVLLCKEEESTTPFFHGGSGTNYFWTGAANASASVYHPPQNISLTSNKVPVRGGNPFCASIYVTGSVAKTYTLYARSYDKSSVKLNEYSTTGAVPAAWTWGRPTTAAVTPASPIEAVQADMSLVVPAVARGQIIYVDSALLESEVSTAGAYFDGSIADSATVTNEWGDRNKPHATFSVQTTKIAIPTLPVAEVPTANTLIASGGPTANTYKMGFFYTFENEFGESAASKAVEIRVKRPWSNWIWETSNASGEPSGTPTETADLAADQLVATVPVAVYNQAIQEGAIRWNLYVFAWSDQEAVPVVAQLAASRDLYADPVATLRAPAQTHDKAGWLTVTPARKLGLNDSILPTRLNRVNFSEPPKSRTGVVAGDRVILLGDPDKLATIRWTSNRPGEYTNFTASRGGGEKTLTSGNLNIPGAIVLWQNPQSVDTLTILCMSLDGMSVSYYMQPAAINAQAGSTTVMGFEETTSTPGTVSPYAGEVLNNALFRPTDFALLKSTASNYNINHKTQTDKIANQWWALRDKDWIMSAVLDNRLYYLVHNPHGALLETGCKGNEIWVYDISAENGHWSRFLIQGAALRVFSLGVREYVGVTRPEGLYYLDGDAREDDYVDPATLKVHSRPIPWRFETNTQGANRAHDAWAHLQQVQVTLGDFTGSLKYGIHGQDVNGNIIDTSKLFSDDRPVPDDDTLWDVDDILQVRRDMKEWYFYASSVDGKSGTGQIGYVQYRYTPVSVNVGYEYGSVETFEYGLNVETGPTTYSDNGIPIPYMDYTRP
jgi:hypothetical protein